MHFYTATAIRNSDPIFLIIIIPLHLMPYHLKTILNYIRNCIINNDIKRSHEQCKENLAIKIYRLYIRHVEV